MARGQRLRQRGQIWQRFISLHFFFTLSVSNCASTFTARALTLAGSDLVPFLALDGQDRHGLVAPMAADRDGGVIVGSSLACACATWHLARPSLPRQPRACCVVPACDSWVSHAFRVFALEGPQWQSGRPIYGDGTELCLWKRDIAWPRLLRPGSCASPAL